MKRWRVETRVTVFRIYFLNAETAKDAEASCCDAQCDFEEDENEETISIVDVPSND
jgi:hypothetical protein